MKRDLLGLVLLLSACAAPAPAVVDRGPLLPVEAQRVIDAATATAQGMATENALATAQRRGTEQALGDAITATSFSAQMIATQTAAPLTAIVAQFQFEQTQAAATREALATMRAESATQSAVMLAVTQTTRDAASRQRLDNALYYVCIGTPLALVVIVLWYVRSYLALLVTNQSVNGVRAVRVTGGTLVYLPARGGMQEKFYPALPAAAQPADAEFDTDEELPEESPMHFGARARILNDQDERNRRTLLKFLNQAIAINGSDSDQLPGFREMGCATATWSRAVELLGGLVESRRGRNGGTWLVGEYRTLGELRLAVGERRFTPAHPASTVIVDSPAPADPEAAAEWTT
jgi:hypothetical protein